MADETEQQLGFTDQNELAPAWRKRPPECHVCGYSLHGLATTNRCPECGTDYPEHSLVVYGIPQSSARTPVWRQLMWAFVIAGGFAVSHFVALLMIVAWYLVLALAAVVVGAAVWLLMTNQRERSGVERLVFTRTCVIRMPRNTEAGGKNLGSVVIPFEAGMGVEFKRISATWKRMAIYTAWTNGLKRGVVLAAGYRCVDADAAMVESTIRAMMAGERVEGPRVAAEPAYPPTTRLSTGPARRP